MNYLQNMAGQMQGQKSSPGIDWSKMFQQQGNGQNTDFLSAMYGGGNQGNYEKFPIELGQTSLYGPGFEANGFDNAIPEGFDWNQGFENFGNVMQGLNMGMSAYTGLKGLDMAKKQFKFQKKAYNTNLQNQYQDLNRGLEGKYRDLVAGGNAGDYSSMDDYVNKNKFG